MNQLPAIVVYACAAIVVPVLLARFVVGAEWRSVRNACIIWYGFLFLALGAGRHADAFGWALIMAMFFSILAIPLIALVLRGWSWLGRNRVGVASTGPTGHWLQRLPLSLMSPVQWSALALLATGAGAGKYWYEQRDLHARADILRPFVGLPAGTKFTNHLSRSSPAEAPRLAATVKFTKRDFETFVAQLDQTPIWQRRTPRYGGAPVEVTSIEGIRWRDLPLPVHAGNRFVNWTKLSSADVKNLRRGRILCVALRRKPESHLTKPSSDAPRFLANDCTALAKTERVQHIVVGALDFDTRTLHMMIN